MLKTDPTRAPQAAPVLLVSLSLRFGGADVRVMQLARALHAAGHVYVVATLNGSGLYDKLVADGLHAVGVGQWRASPLLLVRLLRLIRRKGYRVVDAHNPQSQFWGLGAARLAGAPVRISTVHSIYGKADAGRLHRALYLAVLRLNRLWGCRFITVSQEISEHLAALAVPAARVRLITNGIEDGSGVEASRIRNEAGWSDDDFVVGIFGRLTPIKGHEVLFEALRRLCKAGRSARCLVVGDGPMRDRLTEVVRVAGLDGAVRFTGFRSDIAALMQACEVICQPSFSEGLPFSVLEAAVQGKPLVMSAVGALPDHFEHRRTACLVPPGDVDALTEHLDWCRREPGPAAAMGAAARALILERFDIAGMIAETFALYAGTDQAGD